MELLFYHMLSPCRRYEERPEPQEDRYSYESRIRASQNVEKGLSTATTKPAFLEANVQDTNRIGGEWQNAAPLSGARQGMKDRISALAEI
jgi:hypothetical protein